MRYHLQRRQKPQLQQRPRNGYSNRNNLNLIALSQAKVAAKPHLLPVAHELGHRWLGEETLFVPDRAEAACFFKESLDEYMTLLFARNYYDRERFRTLFETEYLQPAQALRGTADDRRLIDMRRNCNDRVVYAKGPVVLEKVASVMGYDRWIAFMPRFYAAYRCRSPCRLCRAAGRGGSGRNHAARPSGTLLLNRTSTAGGPGLRHKKTTENNLRRRKPETPCRKQTLYGI